MPRGGARAGAGRKPGSKRPQPKLTLKQRKPKGDSTNLTPPSDALPPDQVVKKVLVAALVERQAVEFKPEYIDRARALAAMASTDTEIADVLGISIKTFNQFMAEQPAFRKACELSEAACDARVKRALFQRCAGFSYDQERVVSYKGESAIVLVRQYFPPDPGSIEYWLNNRMSTEWRRSPDMKLQPIVEVNNVTTTNDNRVQVVATVHAPADLKSMDDRTLQALLSDSLNASERAPVEE